MKLQYAASAISLQPSLRVHRHGQHPAPPLLTGLLFRFAQVSHSIAWRLNKKMIR